MLDGFRVLIVTQYVARYAPDEVDEALDRVVAEVGGEPEAFVAAAARRTLSSSDW